MVCVNNDCDLTKVPLWATALMYALMLPGYIVLCPFVFVCMKFPYFKKIFNDAKVEAKDVMDTKVMPEFGDNALSMFCKYGFIALLLAFIISIEYLSSNHTYL